MNYISVDYLELRFLQDEKYMLDLSTIYSKNSTICLEKTRDFRYYHNKYECCFDITLGKQKIGYLYSKPIRNPFYKEHQIISIRFDNIFLKTGNLHSTLKDLSEGLKVEVQGITRLDMSIDTDENVLGRFKEYYNNPSNYSFKNRGKLKVIGTGKFDYQTTIGSLLTRTKSIIIYDKTKELTQKDDPYMREVHQKVFGRKNVYRVEVRLYSKTTKEFEIDIYRLDDEKYFVEVFSFFLKSMIDFRLKEKNSNITNQKKIDFMEINTSDTTISKKIKPSLMEKGNNSIKFMIKKLYQDSEDEMFENVKEQLIFIIERYVERYGLRDWYDIRICK